MVTEGPERSAIAAAVRTKRPAPMIGADAESDERRCPERSLQGDLAVLVIGHQAVDRLCPEQ